MKFSISISFHLLYRHPIQLQHTIYYAYIHRQYGIKFKQMQIGNVAECKEITLNNPVFVSNRVQNLEYSQQYITLVVSFSNWLYTVSELSFIRVELTWSQPQ